MRDTGCSESSDSGFIADGELRNDKGELVRVMIMEHVEGPSLSDEIGLLRRGNRLDYEDSMEIVLELRGPEYMSDQDPLYHRDLKPANIVSNPDRGAVLIDFGLAKESMQAGHQRLQGGLRDRPAREERWRVGTFTDGSASARSPGTS